MRFKFTSQRIDAGARAGTNNIGHATTHALVNQFIAGKDIMIDASDVTEAQLQGIQQYIRACATGLDTSSIETAILAVI